MNSSAAASHDEEHKAKQPERPVVLQQPKRTTPQHSPTNHVPACPPQRPTPHKCEAFHEGVACAFPCVASSRKCCESTVGPERAQRSPAAGNGRPATSHRPARVEHHCMLALSHRRLHARYHLQRPNPKPGSRPKQPWETPKGGRGASTPLALQLSHWHRHRRPPPRRQRAGTLFGARQGDPQVTGTRAFCTKTVHLILNSHVKSTRLWVMDSVRGGGGGDGFGVGQE